MTTHLRFPAICPDCGFSSADIALLNGHSCSTQSNGGHCEDYPCCGHEFGDCNGLLYGSDEAIKAEAMAHPYCDHEAGIYACWDDEDDDEAIENCIHPGNKSVRTASTWNEPNGVFPRHPFPLPGSEHWRCDDCGEDLEGPLEQWVAENL